MKIDRLILGMYETNCYVLRNSDADKDCLVIDPGLDANELINFLKEHKLNPVAVVLTHGHIDHIAGLAELRSHFPDIKVSIHKLDSEMLTEPQMNLSVMSGAGFTTDPEDVAVEQDSVIEQAGVTLLVLHTPGHTPGGISLYSKEHGIAFVGDTIFAGSIGRTDFPGGSMSKLLNSVKEKIFTLPDETQLYPGHGPATTVAIEKAQNPFF